MSAFVFDIAQGSQSSVFVVGVGGSGITDGGDAEFLPQNNAGWRHGTYRIQMRTSERRSCLRPIMNIMRCNVSYKRIPTCTPTTKHLHT